MKLIEITDKLQEAIEKYINVDLDKTADLSEILRTLDTCLSYLVHVEHEYRIEYNNIHTNSQERTEAGKTREAERLCPELNYLKKILRHYGETQKSLRTQISLRKRND